LKKGFFMENANHLVRLIFASGLAARIWATPPPEPEFPMAGGSLGQAIQLNIRTVGDPQISQPRCQAILSFRDSANLQVGPTRSVDLGEDEAASLTVNFSQFVSRFGQRFDLRPIVTRLSREANFSCQTSVELFDSMTGRTLAWTTPPEPGAPSSTAPPEPELPPVSGALGQTMRFGIVRTTASSGISDPDELPACSADLIFHNSRGVIVAQKRVLLQPGHSDFLDLNVNTQVSRFGERAVLQPCLQPVSTGSANGCVASVQVFDQITGWTTVVASAPLR
jgi:hypothetical protein